jgi:hypothetical protein
MAMTDEAMTALCEAMRNQYGAGVEFEVALGELVGRYRAAHDRRMRDAEAAKLLPLGPDVVAERLGVCRRSVYYMAERGRKESASRRETLAQIA